MRPLERDDLSQVASLFERVFPSQVPSSEIARYLERTILDHPWADPEIPSLVYVEDDGRVVGFIGSLVRRFRFEGQPVRVASSAHLIAAPEVRHRAVGALLAMKYLQGPQDLTFTDTASEEARRMWAGLGGQTANLGSISWTRVFRPVLLAAIRFGHGPRPGSVARPVRAVCSALDGLIVHTVGGPFRTKLARQGAEPVTADALLAHLPEMTRQLRLYPDYDRKYLEWLFRELPLSGQPGSLEGSLVRDGDRVLGWYLYYSQPGGISRVLQIFARDRDLGPVLDHLFHHARINGAAALDGRVEPRLLESLSQRRCVLRYTGEWLLHSRDPRILNAALSRQALLTRMEGEWWSIPP